MGAPGEYKSEEIDGSSCAIEVMLGKALGTQPDLAATDQYRPLLLLRYRDAQSCEIALNAGIGLWARHLKVE